MRVARAAGGPAGGETGPAAPPRRLSDRTERLYAASWGAFLRWCAAEQRAALPAEGATILAYLGAATTLGTSGRRVALAAIGHHHRSAGLPWSPHDPLIRAAYGATPPSSPRPAAALTSDDLRRLLAACRDEGRSGRAALPGLRDRALLLLCFAAGLRRSEVVALDRSDLSFTRAGLTVTLRTQDGEGEGARLHVGFGRAAETCPVRVLEAWLRRARIDYGAVFPRMTAAGTMEARLTGQGVWRILRRRAAQAGLDLPEGMRLSTQSLRAGFITEAYGNGAREEALATHLRHKDIRTTRRYRPERPLPSESATRFLDL